ncbi:hypothetical protein ACT691_02060 [Vibrio metschnikovii]
MGSELTHPIYLDGTLGRAKSRPAPNQPCLKLETR